MATVGLRSSAARADGAAAPVAVATHTFSSLEDWARSCGVRRVGQLYERLSEEAERYGRTIPEELKIRGFRDFDAFSRSCPPFDLTCWPVELAELGSGYVLYFHFVLFLAALLGVAFLLSTPALHAYAREDRRCLWPVADDWLRLYSSAGEWQNETCGDGGIAGLGHRWLTPGNLGPDSDVSLLVPGMYSFLVAMVCAVVFAAYQHQAATDQKIDHRMVLPNDFAVLVRDLPAGATEEQAIADFFSEHAVPGKSDTPIAKVVIGWDHADFKEKIKEVQSLRSTLEELGPENPDAKPAAERLKAINLGLASVASGRARSQMKASGTVVVVFRHAADAEACLLRWSGFWARWAYHEPLDAPGLPPGNGLIAGGALPRFPIGGDPVMKISVRRAPNPGDINWEHLAVDTRTRVQMQLRTNSRMALIIGISFLVIYGVNRLQDLVAEASGREGGGAAFALSLLAVLLAMGVAVANAALVVMARRLVAQEYHDTVTDQEFSQTLKMTVGMVVNTAGVVFVCNAQPREWYKAGGLVADLFWTLAVNSFFVPLVQLVDLPYLLRSAVRHRRLSQDKLDSINERLAKVGASPEDRRERLQAAKELEAIRRMYEPSPMNNSRRYANTLKTFLCCLLFTPVMPWLSLIGMLGLLLQYAVDKYMLLRWNKRPEKPANSNMARFSLRVVKLFAPMSLAVMSFVFLCPSWADKAAIVSNFWSAAGIAFVCSFLIPYSLFTWAARRWASSEKSADDYYVAQYKWPRHMKYHKDQFVYKLLPESVCPEYIQPDGGRRASGVSGVGPMLSMAKARLSSASGGGSVHQTSTGMSAKPSVYGVPSVTHKQSSVQHRPTTGRIEEEDGRLSIGRPSMAGVAAASAAAVHAAPQPPPGVAGLTKKHDAGGDAVVDGVVEPLPCRPSTARVVWEFEVYRGWQSFGADCQDELEELYQAFSQGTGPSAVQITTQGRTISIQFHSMTSKLQGTGKKTDRVRAIRRKHTE